MVLSLFRYRCNHMQRCRLNPARLFLPAAFLVALNQTALGLGFSISYAHLKRLTTLSQSSSSSSSSSVQSTQGSSAVRSLKPPLPTDAKQLQLLSFYRFIHVDDPNIIRDALFHKLALIEGLRGTVYIASEGLNAQFAVPLGEPLDKLLFAFGGGDSSCLPFDMFEKNRPNMGHVVDSDVSTFDRLIVRTRDYILRDGINLSGDGEAATTFDWDDGGIEIDAEEWDSQLRSQPNIQVLDCRNAYETEKGTFLSATPLNTNTFSDTWSVLDSQVELQTLNTDEPVYIYCTGGVRCVKVGAYLKQKLGASDVRSLRHGIIGYENWSEDQEEDPKHKSLWQGDNFLFDKRRFAKESNESSDDEE